MKPDKLECLLYCFKYERCRDDVDAVMEGNISDVDAVMEGNISDGDAVMEGNISSGSTKPKELETKKQAGDKRVSEDRGSRWWNNLAKCMKTLRHIGYVQYSFKARAEDPHLPLDFALALSTISIDQNAQVVAAGRELARLVARFESSQPQRSAVEFKSSCEIVNPQKQTISLTVVRSPSCTETPLKVKWKTHNRTAVAGIHYLESSGEIVFEEGVMEKDIKIDILSSSTSYIDLRFQVQLSVENCVFTPRPMTVTIKNIDKFYAEEQSVLNNLRRSCSSSCYIGHVKCVLDRCLNYRTFHTALSYACSKADSINLEFALAFELSRMCMQSLRNEEILQVLGDFFRMDEDDL